MSTTTKPKTNRFISKKDRNFINQSNKTTLCRTHLLTPAGIWVWLRWEVPVVVGKDEVRIEDRHIRDHTVWNSSLQEEDALTGIFCQSIGNHTPWWGRADDQEVVSGRGPLLPVVDPAPRLCLQDLSQDL